MLRLEKFFRAHGAAIRERRKVLPFHAEILRYCERWIAGNLPDSTRNLAICMPPRHGKTYIARDLVAYGLGLFPDSEWIYTSSSATLATTQTIAIKSTVSSDWYHRIFPRVGVRPGKGRQDFFRTAHGGSVYAVGVGGTITGFGAGKKRRGFGGGIVIDDPLQAQDAYSAAVRESCNVWYTQTLYSRRNSDTTPVLLIMQRLHEQDLVGYLLEHEPELWTVLEIPVRDSAGNVLWPETFSADSADRLEAFDSYAFSAQYMQSPTPAGGAIFQKKDISIVDSVPAMQTVGIFCDTAMKETEYADYSVLTYAGTDGRDCYILDIDRGKWAAPVLLEHAREFWQKHMPDRLRNPARFLGMYVEDKSSGTGLIQTIRAQTSIPIIAVQRTRDKVSRAHDISQYVASGRLKIKRASWNDSLISEMASFSPLMTHAHDDIVDTVIDAVSTLLAPQGGPLAGADWS